MSKQDRVRQRRKAGYTTRVFVVGHSRCIAVTKVIPHEWKFVRVKVRREFDKVIELVVSRLE